MAELMNAGNLNVFWFFVSLLTVVFTTVDFLGYWPLLYLPSPLQQFWYYLLAVFVSVNVLLKIFYSEFIYATTVRSSLLGSVFSIGVFFLSFWPSPWSIVGWYLCVLSGFHFSEFLSIAWCNNSSLSVSSFILNHSREYWIALAASWCEFVAELYFVPVTKTYRIISWVGLALCLIGEGLRKTAMFTASTNFNHVVQLEKEDNHRLITHGIYAWCRHPSYVGWFMWSIGTQLLLMNPICLLAYTYVSWHFFRDRIMVEECYLINFFQDEYLEYQKKVRTGIPLIKGLIIEHEHHEKES